MKSVTGGGVFVTGKFDQYHSGKPPSAITHIFGELCHKVVKEGPSTCNKIKEALHSELQNEVSLLTQ
eukprot:783735-Ditylum_brightwellii.AAC.1